MALRPGIAKALRAATVAAASVALWAAGLGAVVRTAGRADRARATADALPPRPETPPDRVVLDVSRPSLDALPTDREALRARLDALYASSPDARVVRAAETLRARGIALPTEIPRDPAEALTRFAAAVSRAAPSPGSVGHVVELRAGSAVARLREIRGARALARDAARALAVLAFETPDLVGVADVIAAQALATCAIARGDGAPAPDAEALTLYAMGYAAHARRAAEGLAADDPLRAFVRGDALPATTSPGARYLALRRAVEREDDDAVRAWIAAATDAERATVGVTDFVGRSLRRSSDLEGRARRHRAMLPAAVEALAREHGATVPEGSPTARADALYTLAAQEDPSIRDVLRARVAAATLSAMEESLTFALDVRASRREALELLHVRDPVAPFLDTWIAVGRDRARPRDPAADDALLSRARDLSAVPSPLRVLAWSMHQGAGHDDVSLPRFVASLDDRPSHREAALALLIDEGVDLPRAESLCAALEPAAGAPRWPRTWCAGLDHVENESPAAQELRLREGAAAATTWRPARAALAAWLEARGRAPEVAVVAQEFLAARGDDGSLEPVLARVALARAERSRGDVDAAWRAIEPAVATGQEGALLEAAAVRLARNELAPALELARRAHERFGDVATAARLAEVQWRAGHLRDAATTLTALPTARDRARWPWEAAPAFSAVFGAQRPGAASAAAEVLRGAGADDDAVEAIALRLARDGHLPHALAVHETIPVRDAHDAPRLLTRHALRARIHGPAEADAWLATHSPPRSLTALTEAAFARGDDARVWSLDDRSPRGWLLRAAATLRDESLAARRGEALAAVTGDGFEHVAARYLLGRSTLADLARAASTPPRRVAAAYWAGLRAHREGDLSAAADWYRLAERHRGSGEVEGRWSRDALARWFAQDRRLAAVDDPWRPAPVIEREPAAPQAPAITHSEEPPRRHHRRHRRHREAER